MTNEYRAVAESVQRRLHSLFIWTPDEKTFGVREDWRSHYMAYRRGVTIRDDCDGFALTAADALLAAGVPRDRIWLAVCRTETGEGHAVCILAGDTTDKSYVIDNRQRWVSRLTGMRGYRWEAATAYDHPRDWFSLDHLTPQEA